LEDNWFEDVEGLRSIADDQWGQLKLPMGLVNAIKKRLTAPATQPVQQPVAQQLQAPVIQQQPQTRVIQ